jgi:hypothetical protein
MDTQRVWRVALLAPLLTAVLLGPPAWAEERRATVRILIQSSPLAGFRYHEAAELWDRLRVGDTLELQREPDNPHDTQAIGVSWQGRKLGYVPRRDNGALAWALDRGERLHARISRLGAHPNPARRIEFEVFIE